MDRELTLASGPRAAVQSSRFPLNVWGSANGHYSSGASGRDGISMHLDMRVVGTEPPSEKDPHAEEPINLQPPLGSLGPSLAWESQLRAEAALCPAFSSACDPSVLIRICGYFLLTGLPRGNRNRSLLGREWRRSSVLWIQYQFCGFPPRDKYCALQLI